MITTKLLLLELAMVVEEAKVEMMTMGRLPRLISQALSLHT